MRARQSRQARAEVCQEVGGRRRMAPGLGGHGLHGGEGVLDPVVHLGHEQLAALRLGPDLGAVPQDVQKTIRMSVRVQQRHHHAARPEAGAVPAQMPAFVHGAAVSIARHSSTVNLPWARSSDVKTISPERPRISASV